jgi:hypothetical protein
VEDDDDVGRFVNVKYAYRLGYPVVRLAGVSDVHRARALAMAYLPSFGMSLPTLSRQSTLNIECC